MLPPMKPRSVVACLHAMLLVVLASGCASSAQTDTSVRQAPSPTTTRSTSRHHRRQHHRAVVHHKHHHRRHHHSGTARVPVVPQGVPSVDVPSPALTPGAVLTTNAATVCVSGYSSSVRDVPDSEKEAVYARYGIPHVPYQHEVDHLVSLELGGSNAITNLWPEPYAGRWGARTKDVLENKLHDLVCSGTIGLRDAQRIEARNWVPA